MADPLAYFITFRTYGTWLPGDERGFVNEEHNEVGAPFLPPNASRRALATKSLRAGPIVLTNEMRGVVDAAIRETCGHRNWTLLALSVRTNHVHSVVSGSATPERMMNDFKAWATRKIVQHDLLPARRPVWVRHGSTRWLWKEADVLDASYYVTNMQ